MEAFRKTFLDFCVCVCENAIQNFSRKDFSIIFVLKQSMKCEMIYIFMFLKMVNKYAFNLLLKEVNVTEYVSVCGACANYLIMIWSSQNNVI